MRSIKFVTVFVIIIHFCYTTTIDAKDDPRPTILKKPLCVLDDYDTTNPTEEFKNFAVIEECQFQLFMDTLQEIDCYIMHEVSNNYSCDTAECYKAVFKVRNEIYEHRVDKVTCKCNQSTSTEEKDNFDYYNNYYFAFKDTFSDEDEPKIYKLSEYIECWKELYKEMNNFIKNKLDDVIKSEPEIEICKTIGKTSDERCNREKLEIIL